jgi:DNA-directed RNA polymerase subunit alpha
MPDEAVTIETKATQRELTLADVVCLGKAARASTRERDRLAALDREFDKRVAPEIPAGEHSFRKAVFAWLLGRTDEAAAAMNRRRQNPVAVFILGMMAEEAGDFAAAVEHYKGAAGALREEPRAALALANAHRLAEETDKAAAALDRVEKRWGEGGPPEIAAEIAYQRGFLLELAGDLEAALDLYNRALELLPTHAEAAFRMGCSFDLRGEDELAVSYYERCAAGGAPHVGAMVNLAMLYEDRGDCERAIACYRDVLRAEPDNRRARLYLDGAIESTEEVYDEMERKEQEKLDQILRTPVADFELSVRSRNVLARMNIRTLGDLVQKTETEMLAFRNFGETSLHEIKHLLGSKGLKLGMRRDEVERRHKRERLALVMSDSDSRKLSTPVSEMNLSVRARRCMARLSIQTVGDLVTRTADELLEMKNFGHTSLNEVRSRLAEMGLSFRQPEETA